MDELKCGKLTAIIFHVLTSNYQFLIDSLETTEKKIINISSTKGIFRIEKRVKCLCVHCLNTHTEIGYAFIGKQECVYQIQSISFVCYFCENRRFNRTFDEHTHIHTRMQSEINAFAVSMRKWSSDTRLILFFLGSAVQYAIFRFDCNPLYRQECLTLFSNFLASFYLL